MNLEKLLISPESSMRQAMKRLDQTATKVLLVVDESRVLLGTLTDGDVRRFLLDGGSLDAPQGIREAYNQTPKAVLQGKNDPKDLKKLLLQFRIELIPLVDSQRRVQGFVTWDQVFSDEEIREHRRAQLDLPVVIMAGGKGSRMAPFTSVFPKPLIPIGDKPLLLHLIEHFYENFGMNRFLLTLNYKSELMKAYLSEITCPEWKIDTVTEEKFLGTAGGLRLLRNQLQETFLITNCDVLARANYEEVLNTHKESGAALTIISALQHYSIPYGVVHFEQGGRVSRIQEKPEQSYAVSTGVYLMDRAALDVIPEDVEYNMTDLAHALIQRGQKVLTYLINEREYYDFGQWEEYRRAINRLRSQEES